MAETEKELLAELYCLRAGISALSLESERVKGEDNRIKGVTVKMEDNVAEIINYNSIVNTSKKTYKSAKHEYESTKRKYDKKSFPLWLHSIVTACLLAVAIYLYSTRNPDARFVFFLDILIGAVLVFALIELVRVLLIKRKLKPLRVQMKNAKQLMLDSKTWIEESKKNAKEVEESNRELKEQKNEYGLSRSDAVSLSIPIAEALYSALIINFGGIIGCSYYNALDFVIDTIRSGSCKDITSALLEVDSKKNSGKFTEEVLSSHEKLLTYVDEDQTELSYELDAAYGKLDKVLQQENERALERIKKLKSHLSGGFEQSKESFAKANSQSSLRVAFNARKSKSSFDMASDIDYIICHEKRTVAF